MTSKQETVDYIIKQMDGAGDVRAKKMFGEYGIFCDGRMVALVCDNQLYVKPTLAGESFLGEPEEAEPYPGAKPCFLISPSQYKDGAWLSELIKISTKELPLPKKRPSKKR